MTQNATGNATTGAPDTLSTLAVHLQGVAAHPLAPAPLRLAVPLLLQVLQQQAETIAQLQAAEAAAAETRCTVAAEIAQLQTATKAAS